MGGLARRLRYIGAYPTFMKGESSDYPTKYRAFSGTESLSFRRFSLFLSAGNKTLSGGMKVPTMDLELDENEINKRNRQG